MTRRATIRGRTLADINAELNAKKAALAALESASYDLAHAKDYIRRIAKLEATRALLMGRALARRSLDEWTALVAAIHPPEVRAQVATLIWWDYFGDQVGPPDTLHKGLAPFMAQWREGAADMRTVCKALIKLGYVERVAVARTAERISEYNHK